jgi:mannose-6-phosphate isomerase-like protein (cupin superfamily)
MVSMVKIRKLSVSEISAKLNKPFSMMNAAFVGDITVSVYVCQGMMGWHKHLDIDELFWVYEGTMLLESDWGEVRLRPGELAVVPKGVGHRSSTGLRATVLLLRCGFVPNRKNGRRRLYALAGEGGLKRVSLPGAAQALAWPFRFQTVARIDGSVVQAAWGAGTWPVGLRTSHDVLLFVLKGTATVRTSRSMLHLHPGDFTVVPQGAVYQLHTTQGTALARLTRENRSPTPLPGGEEGAS